MNLADELPQLNPLWDRILILQKWHHAEHGEFCQILAHGRAPRDRPDFPLVALLRRRRRNGEQAEPGAPQLHGAAPRFVVDVSARGFTMTMIVKHNGKEYRPRRTYTLATDSVSEEHFDESESVEEEDSAV
jgi:hypothetical protein